MENKAIICALLFAIFLCSCNFCSAEDLTKTIQGNSYAINYDDSINQFDYPMEHSIDRIIKIKNTGEETINISFRATVKINGQDTDVSTWPQPMPSYILSGDERELVMKIEWSNDIMRGWIDNGSYDYPINADISIDRVPMKIILYNKVNVIKTEEHLQDIPTNSKITGYVHDSVTGKAILDADVEVWSDGPRVDYRTRTDSSGYYSVPVRAYKRSFLGNYVQYSIRIQDRGYEDYNYAVSPKIGEEAIKDCRLIEATERADYKLINKYFTGLPPARVDFSLDHQYFATVPFHSSEKTDFIKENAYLYFFSMNGSLLWRYKLDNEIPTVDVSDDASLIATAHRPAMDNWDGGDYIMLFNHNGDLIWTYRIPGIGDWSLANYTHPNGILEDGISEVRISHNGKYLAAGTWAGKLFLIDLTSRKLLWGKDLNDGQVRYMLFKEDDSSLYAGSDPYMFNYDMNGDLNWKAFIGSWPYNMVLSKSYVFVGPKVGRFVSLFDKNTGNVIWRYPIDARPDNLLISPDESYFIYQSSNGDLAIKNAFFNSTGGLMFNLNGANSGYITSDSNYIAYYGGESVHLVNRRGNELWRGMMDQIRWPAPRGAVYISDDLKRIAVANAMSGYVYFFEGGVEKVSNQDNKMPSSEEKFDDHNKQEINNDDLKRDIQPENIKGDFNINPKIIIISAALAIMIALIFIILPKRRRK